MTEPREGLRTGTDSLAAVTTLLQRARRSHPTKALYDAADLQWWWRTPRTTDDLPQLFWFDELGRPEAAVIATDWSGGQSAVYDDITIVVIVMPDAAPDWIDHVVERGLVHARESGIRTVELEVDRDDQVMRELLAGRGFAVREEGVITTWLSADDRPVISPLREGYRLSSRRDAKERPHHMIGRSGPAVEERLLQTSLYRPDLDLFVVDHNDDIAAYGLFWYDPETATGLVEPMRTEDLHQRRGLARHVLTTGIDLLARSGAERIRIGFEPGNPASGHLYLSVGFVPDQHTDIFSGRTGAAP